MKENKILQKLLNEKYNSLALQEKELVIKHFVSLMSHNSDFEDSRRLTSDLFQKLENEDRNCISILYGCIGGFIIHRTFSPEYKKEFKIVIIDKEIEDFVREIPVKEKSGVILNLYKILESTIGIKLKVRNAFKLGGKEVGLGVGMLKIDAFEIIIAKDNDVETVIEDMRDLFKLNSKLEAIEYENLKLKISIQELNKIKKPLIISEGKTDWKHFISALRYFHNNKEFELIREDWFLKFGLESDVKNSICGTNFILECCVSELNSILKSFLNSSRFDNVKSSNKKIGIFDSDEKSANIFSDEKSQTFSIKIEPENISTEMLYSDEEIKTIVNGKRLFLGDEFDKKTKRHFIEKDLSLGGDNSSLNKAGIRKIIDNYVYNSNGDNMALTKEIFAQKVFIGEINISNESWENFRHIFNKLNNILIVN